MKKVKKVGQRKELKGEKPKKRTKGKNEGKRK
jgi:hypothetical protein